MSNTVEYDILIEVLDSIKDLKKLQQQSKKTKGGLDETKKSGLTMASEIGAAFTGLKGAASTVIGAVQKVAGAFIDAAQASFELTRAVVDNINDLNDLSNVSGISAQNIEALKLAFVSSGQSADAANTILQQFPRVLNNIQKGTGDAAKAFKGLGIEQKLTKEQLQDGNLVFREIIGSLEGIEDKTLKAQAAAAIFGRSSASVVQALGAGKFDEFTDAIDRFGTKAGPNASAAAGEFQKRLAAVSFIADRTKQSFVESTGALGFFLEALKITQQSLSALNTFFRVGQKQVLLFTRVIVNVLIVAIDGLASKVIALISGPLTGMVRSINSIVKAVTGKDLLGDFASQVASFSIEQVGLKDAVDAAIKAFEGEGRAIDAATQSTNQIIDTHEELDEKVRAFLRTLGASTKKKDKDTKSTKDATKSEREHAKALAATIAKVMQLGKERFAASKKAFDIQNKANEDLLSNLDKINQVEKERLDQLKEITRQQKISTEEAQKAVSARAARERAAIAEAERARGVQAAGAALGGAAGAVGAISDPSGLVSAVGSAFGPIGAGISELINAVAALGEKSPEQIQQEYQTFFNAIVNGLKILPEILIKTLPAIIAEGLLTVLGELQALPFKVALSFLEVGKEIVNGFKGGIVEGLIKIKDFFADGLNLLFGPLIDGIKGIVGFFTGESFASGGRFLSGQGGLRFTGQQQGLAMLHQGEMVVPRSGQMSSSVRRDVQSQVGTGGVTININSAITERSAVDALVRKIEQRFSGFGQSTSPLFGGL